MHILSRYIFRELLGPTLLGFAFYTFVILIRNLFEFAEVIIKRSLPASTVFEMLALSIPHIIVLTIPMSLLFGVLIAIGRLSADSEIIAMRSSGMSTAAIYKPVFIFSFCIFLINLYLMNFVLPRGNSALEGLKGEIFTSAVGQTIKPRIFFDDYENWVVYINDIDPASSLWKGVFVSDASDPTQQRVVVAERGALTFMPDTRQVWLNLDNAETHVFSPAKTERYDLNRNARQQMMLVERDEDQVPSQSRSLKSLNLRELLRLRETKQYEIDRRLTLVEIHKKFSIPFACLAFGIIGLPLGITNRRGGKSSGFSLSIAIILLYYVAINNGEDLARDGKVPAGIAMWTPNIIMVVLGIYLMFRANSDAGSSTAGLTLMSRLGALFQKFSRKNRGRSAEVVTERQSILSRLDIPFPNTLDRYILREFVKILLLVLVSTGVLFVIVDYTEMAGEISENNIPTDMVLTYYRLHVIQVLNWILPLSVLVGTLVTFGIFAKNNEITAVKANGVSLYRIALPIIAVAGVVTVLAYLLLDFVLPYSNDRLSRLRNHIKGRESAQSFSLEQRQWIFGEGGRHLFNFLSFDKKNGTLGQVQIFEFHPTQFKLTRRIYAERAAWDGKGWVFSNGWIRSFGDDGTASFSPFKEGIRLHYTEKPEYFALEVKRPEQMSYTELRHYIADLEKAGYAADDLLVKLYEKTSWPFLSLVMALIALPFAFRIGSKQGALYGIGIALFLAFSYWAIFGVFTKFGEVGNLPAMLSAWSANILFSLAAVYLFLRVET